MENNSCIQDYHHDKYEDFYNVIKTANIKSVFQPIVSLTDCTIIGYEALSRGPQNSNMQNPEVLLDIAKECDKLWELEDLFRSKALESIYNSKLDVKIFLNINPGIIDSLKFKNSFTEEYLRKYDLHCKNIIFEITERDLIKDIDRFKETIEYCKSKNYQIAIDDAGSGHSGLNRICHINPHYIKLDIELIRNIDKYATKQAIVRSMYEFSKLTGCNLIAEGIETEEELKTLIEIGVQYGQGYFIQRPNEQILPIENKILKIINNSNNKLCVDYKTPIHKVIDLAMSRKKEKLYDNVIVTRDSKYYGVITIKDLIEKFTEVKIYDESNFRLLQSIL